jgi:hypothetical protein
MMQPLAHPPGTGASEGAAAQLLTLGRSALTALIELVPRAVWRGFKGSFAGFFLTGFLGLIVAGTAAAASALHVMPQPRWLVLVNLAWVPFVLAIAGGYAGAINGFLSTLSEEVEERGLGVRIFAVVKPACTAVVRRARGGNASNLSADLRAALEARLDDGPEQRPASLAERAERFLAARSRRLLCFSVLRTVVTAKDRDTAIRELESFGAQRLTTILADTIEDLFSAQVFFAAALALIAAAAPTLVFAIAR